MFENDGEGDFFVWDGVAGARLSDCFCQLGGIKSRSAKGSNMGSLTVLMSEDESLQSLSSSTIVKGKDRKRAFLPPAVDERAVVFLAD